PPISGPRSTLDLSWSPAVCEPLTRHPRPIAATSGERDRSFVRSCLAWKCVLAVLSMLLDPKSDTDLDSKLADEPARTTSRPVQLLVLVLVVGALGAGGYRLLVGAKSAPTAAEKVQLLVREGERVTVPEGSPLRARLAIAPVAEQDIKRSLILP